MMRNVGLFVMKVILRTANFKSQSANFTSSDMNDSIKMFQEIVLCQNKYPTTVAGPDNIVDAQPIKPQSHRAYDHVTT